MNISLCYFWRCAQCGTVHEKTNVAELWYRLLGPHDATIPGAYTCATCGTEYGLHDVYLGKYDIPYSEWDDFERKTGRIICVNRDLMPGAPAAGPGTPTALKVGVPTAPTSSREAPRPELDWKPFCKKCLQVKETGLIVCSVCGSVDWSACTAVAVTVMLSVGAAFFWAPHIESSFWRVTVRWASLIIGTSLTVITVRELALALRLKMNRRS